MDVNKNQKVGVYRKKHSPNSKYNAMVALLRKKRLVTLDGLKEDSGKNTKIVLSILVLFQIILSVHGTIQKGSGGTFWYVVENHHFATTVKKSGKINDSFVFSICVTSFFMEMISVHGSATSVQRGSATFLVKKNLDGMVRRKSATFVVNAKKYDIKNDDPTVSV